MKPDDPRARERDPEASVTSNSGLTLTRRAPVRPAPQLRLARQHIDEVIVQRKCRPHGYNDADMHR